MVVKQKSYFSGHRRGRMSVFSDKIQEVIHESGYTVYQISKGAGIGRTSIYKMMTGKLLPSREFMNHFYHYMRLRPSERQELEYLYLIEKDGRERYENRLFIKQILEGIQSVYPLDESLEFENSSGNFLTEEMEHGQNQFSTLELINRVLKKEMEDWDTPFIRMNLPVSSKCIFDLVYQHCKRSRKQFLIRQIVMMNQNPGKTKDANCNLKILHRVLPLVQSFPGQYQVHCCYTRCGENDSYAFFWPYYLITHEHVVMISENGTSAYLQKEKGIVGRYQEEFQQLFNRSDVLLEPYQDAEQIMQRYFHNYDKYGMPKYILRSNPGLIYMFSYHQFMDQIKNKFEKSPFVLEMLSQYYVRWQERKATPIEFFSQKGLENFIRSENRESQWRPKFLELDKEIKNQMIQRFLKEIPKGMKSHMIPKNNIIFPQSLILEIFETNKVILFNNTPSSKLSLIQIEEPSICEAFLDFFEYLIETEMVLSTEKTKEYIEQMLR